jgi:hypothetical protein
MASTILIANRGSIAGRVACALAAFACVGASDPPPPPPPAAIIEPLQGPITLTAMPLDRAFALFRTLCMDPFPDPAAVERAVLAAGLGFTPGHRDNPGERLWDSPHGTVFFRGASAMADGRPMQDCDLRFLMPDPLTRAELVERIGQALAPGRPRRNVDTIAIWDLGGNFADRLQYFPASPDIRYFSLNRRHIDTGPSH